MPINLGEKIYYIDQEEYEKHKDCYDRLMQNSIENSNRN